MKAYSTSCVRLRQLHNQFNKIQIWAGKGLELIDTQALIHLTCLGYAVNHEEDEEIEHRHEKSMREAMSEILSTVSMSSDPFLPT